MIIIFTRHGESEANIAGIISNRSLPHPLTAKGRQQAHLLAAALAVKNIRAIYASPILRTQQTAQILGQAWGLSVQTADALREFDCGEMEGRGDAEAWEAHHAVIRAWDEANAYEQRIPGGESFTDMRQRFVPFVEEIRELLKEDKGDIVLVSHGSLLLQMLPLVLSNVDRAFCKAHPLRNCAMIVTTTMETTLHCLEWDGLALSH